MAEDQDKQDDDLDGLTEDDAKRLLDPPAKPSEPATDSTDYKAEADKWKRLSRKNEDGLKTALDKLTKYEDANKSEAQRRDEERDSYRSRAEKAELRSKRRDVAEDVAEELAAERGDFTRRQVRTVVEFLTGETDEELTAQAKKLFALISPTAAPPKQQPVPSKPKERLRGGGAPDDGPGEMDPKRLAALIPRAR